MLPLHCFLALLFLNPNPSPPPLPDRHAIGGVPFVLQKKEYCGPAALCMVFRYYDVSIPQERLAEEIYLKKLSGTLNLDMLIAARRHGFSAESPAGSLAILKEYVARGVPVIALVESPPDTGRFHYLVIYGYDDEKKKLSAHSGRRKATTIAYEDFEKAWQAARNWMLVVERKKDWP